MKKCFPTAVLIACVVTTAVTAGAAESFSLQTQVYVYRNSDVSAAKSPGAAATAGSAEKIFFSPAVIEFGQEKLSLDGSNFAWSSGRNPPKPFSLIATPTLRSLPATLLSSESVQYF